MGEEIVVKGRKSVCVLDIECAFAEQQGYMIRALRFTELFFDVPVFLIIKDSRDARKLTSKSTSFSGMIFLGNI